MTTLINRKDAPSHLFSIPGLDFSEDLFSTRLGGTWFRLGSRSIKHHRDKQHVEDFTERQTILLAPNCFAQIFDRLESIGNAIGELGKPKSSISESDGHKEYIYFPFYKFQIIFTSVVGEPIVSINYPSSGSRFFINPDIRLFFELEEKTPGSDIWWDPRRGVEALRRCVIDVDNLEIVEIRTDYLLKYLKMRQMSLVVGHYRGLSISDSPQSIIEKFVQGDITLGLPEQGVKVIVQNCGPRTDIPGKKNTLMRRLHLWFQITPPELDLEDPWEDPPPFDPYTFTLPTRSGSVAPAHWKGCGRYDGSRFEGVFCDFTDQIYFRQEVLTKYEGAAGFEIGDNGSVSCRNYWGLFHSSRIGNELIATAIGDFAEGVPFEEWPHWKQYAVQPPSLETLKTLRNEQTISAAVNAVVEALDGLNNAFNFIATSLGLDLSARLWLGSLDSLSGRQLKWVYPSRADDDEFLKRATLTSTLVIDGLESSVLRKLLRYVNKDLHKNKKSGETLASRNLLQRMALLALLIEKLMPDFGELSALICRAEGAKANVGESDLQEELKILNNNIRDEFAPLAFLYDLRVHGGLAHRPNKEEAKNAALKLGLPKENWHRGDYIHLLNLVTSSIRKISKHLKDAARILTRDEHLR